MKSTTATLFLLVVNIAVLVIGAWALGGFGSAEAWPTSGYVAGGLAIVGCITVFTGAWTAIQRLRRKNSIPILVGLALLFAGLMIAGLFGFAAMLLKTCYVDGICL